MLILMINFFVFLITWLSNWISCMLKFKAWPLGVQIVSNNMPENKQNSNSCDGDWDTKETPMPPTATLIWVSRPLISLSVFDSSVWPSHSLLS